MNADPERLQELLVADTTVIVSINVCEYLRGFSLGEPEPVVVQTLHEFVSIQFSVAVVVHDTKRPKRRTCS